MEAVVKGMVQAAGATYRIVRLEHGQYNVVRVLDDVGVGSFISWPTLEVKSVGVDAALMHEIARVAVRRAKTSCVGRLALS